MGPKARIVRLAHPPVLVDIASSLVSKMRETLTTGSRTPAACSLIMQRAWWPHFLMPPCPPVEGAVAHCEANNAKMTLSQPPQPMVSASLSPAPSFKSISSCVP